MYKIKMNDYMHGFGYDEINCNAKYMDVIERTFLNALLASVDMEGDKFFYENVLRRTRKLEYRLMWPLARSKYISSFCCPPNVARTIMQSREYAYTTKGNKVYIGLYGSSCAQICFSNFKFQLEQTTDYPYSGNIYLHAKNRIGNGNAKIMVRIPGWVSVGKIVTKNKCIYIDKTLTNTYVEIDVNQEQYEIYIDFEMKERFTEANPLVEECVNQVAIERGPLVYCLEECDVESGTVDDLWIAFDSCFNEVEFEIKEYNQMRIWLPVLYKYE